MSKKFFLCTAIWILIFSPFALAGSIVNSGFESSVAGTKYDIPSDWTTENYVESVDGFVPNNYNGVKTSWQIDVTTELTAYEGSKFVLLSTGDSSVNYAKISQQVTLQAGDIITGAYFFGACDYYSWEDYATITLVAQAGSGLTDIELVNIGIAEVGDYGSTDGWVTFQSEVITALTAGTYTLECTVFDLNDFQLESYFAVDGIAIIPEPASIMLLISGLLIIRKK